MPGLWPGLATYYLHNYKLNILLTYFNVLFLTILPMKWLSFQSQSRPAHVRREVFVAPSSHFDYMTIHFYIIPCGYEINSRLADLHPPRDAAPRNNNKSPIL